MWYLILAVEILAIDLLRPLELGSEAVEITLISPDDDNLRRQVSAIAADPDENLVLRLRSVETGAESQVSWEVYVASSDNADCDNIPALAGILSSYGAQPIAEFVFPLDSPVVVGEPVGLKVIFKPISGLVLDGKPIPPTVQTSVRIGAISLETEGLARTER